MTDISHLLYGSDSPYTPVDQIAEFLKRLKTDCCHRKSIVLFMRQRAGIVRGQVYVKTDLLFYDAV